MEVWQGHLWECADAFLPDINVVFSPDSVNAELDALGYFAQEYRCCHILIDNQGRDLVAGDQFL